MPLGRKTLTPDEAGAYTRDLERQAASLGTDLGDWVLGPGKPNDIRVGKGPRFAIVAYAQEAAARGATYRQVLGGIVIRGDGSPYTIRTCDLAGFVCANGYCTLQPPGWVQPQPTRVLSAPVAISPVGVTHVPVPEGTVLPHPSLLGKLSSAYPCPGFQGACRTMRWDPPQGHIPRGFLGATGTLEEVELVLVFAEPGDPRPGDHASLEEALRHATWAFRDGQGLFHRNVRRFLELCWPGLPFEQHLRKVWMTESVLCSAEVTTGPVAGAVARECARRHLASQLALFPHARVVAFGGKAQQRLERLGISHLKAHALAPPGCNQRAALPSWESVAARVRDPIKL